jgi:hypothetical protein
MQRITYRQHRISLNSFPLIGSTADEPKGNMTKEIRNNLICNTLRKKFLLKKSFSVGEKWHLIVMGERTRTLIWFAPIWPLGRRVDK